MKKRYKIIYSRNFHKKIHQITNYITYHLQNPIATYHFQIKMKQTISVLNYFSQAGPKYKNTKYHYLLMKHWIILYEIQNNEVEMIDIFSSKQNSKKIQLS